MSCPNCGGKVYEHINNEGGGSHYCLDGCGYYKEFPIGTMTPPPRRVEPPRKVPPRRVPRKKDSL